MSLQALVYDRIPDTSHNIMTIKIPELYPLVFRCADYLLPHSGLHACMGVCVRGLVNASEPLHNITGGETGSVCGWRGRCAPTAHTRVRVVERSPARGRLLACCVFWGSRTRCHVIPAGACVCARHGL